MATASMAPAAGYRSSCSRDFPQTRTSEPEGQPMQRQVGQLLPLPIVGHLSRVDSTMASQGRDGCAPHRRGFPSSIHLLAIRLNSTPI